MPPIGPTHKSILYSQPIMHEKITAAVNMQINYSKIFLSDIYLETDRSDFYSDENEMKVLVPEHKELLRKPPVNLEWRNISLKTPEGKKILKGLNGSAHSGELTAIMGPSGAGKTSLLNVLTGYSQKRMSGQIYVNGVQRDMMTFRKQACYILQDDHIMNEFTVKELITMASKLKLPTAMSEKEKREIVKDLIYSFGLDAQQNQIVRTLSGGQRKRVGIAQEIVNNPPFIFLDEPTSGLDSSSSLQCMQLLKSLAIKGRNVICTIHQPSSRICEIFDNMYMISEGQCIFRGPTKNLIPFLASQCLECPKNHSPTDFITDVAIGVYGDWNWKLRNAIESADDTKNRWYKIDSKKTELPESKCCKLSSFFALYKKKVKDVKKQNWIDESLTGYATGFCNQFKVLLKRSFFSIVRAPQVLSLKLVASIGAGLLFGSVLYDTGNDASLMLRTSALFFILMSYLVITASLLTTLTFPAERAIFEREHMNGWYSTAAYYTARTIADFPLQIILPSITSIIAYWMNGQPMESSRIGLFVLSNIILSLISESVGFLFSVAFSFESALYLGAVVLCPQLLLSGFIGRYADIPSYMRWSCSIMYTKFGLMSIYKIIYTDRQPMECSRKETCFFKDPSFFLKFKGAEGEISKDYWIMLQYLLVLKIIAFAVLYFKACQKR